MIAIAVQTIDADPIALGDSERPERAGQPGDAIDGLAHGAGAIPEHGGHLVRIALELGVQGLGDVHPSTPSSGGSGER